MMHKLVAENSQLRDQLAQLLAQAHQNQQILQRHQALDLQLISADSFETLIDTIFQTFPTTTGLDLVTLVLFDPDYEIRRILVELNINFAELPQLIFMQETSELGELHGMLSGSVLGPYAEELHGPAFPEPLHPPSSVALVPLMRHMKLNGCLCLGSRDEKRFASHMGTDFLEHMASIVAICLENVINNERLKHIGLTDPLTGVNNRRYVERRMLEEIGRNRRQQSPLSCMYIDIDHFKKINDRIGHQAGDEVLCEVAGRIKAELRLSDALGRFGGEEFVVLLIDADIDDAVSVAERIRESIADQPLVLATGDRLDVTVSIGVASLTHPGRNESIEKIAQDFVAQADQALYQAKTGGRNRVIAGG